MASRWVKGAFLAILGVVLLLYTDKFVDDLERELSQDFEIAFTATWDLLRILMWILVAWLFVDAALTIALSFTEHRYTLRDVVQRLEAIERKLGIAKPKPASRASEPVPKPEFPPEEEVPPPPKE
ncbi:MAG: hypothetical protein ACUVT7_03040 [Thermoplasmata archaeon]